MQWPSFAKLIIFFLMFVGGCAGSTSGGIKTIRHLVFFKRILYNIKSMFNSSGIMIIKYNSKEIDATHSQGILTFILTYLGIFIISTFIMISIGLDFHTSAGSVATTMGGIGPGFGLTGPSGNFAEISVFGKYFLSFLMILGRLEIYTILILFTPSFWKI